MSAAAGIGPIAKRLIEHALHLDGQAIPATARAAAAWFSEDSLLVGLSAARVPEREKLLAVFGQAPADQGARVLGQRYRLPAAVAALVNGFQIHGQEFDCVHEPAVVHPMAVIAAVLLAYSDRATCSNRADDEPVSGKAWLEAVIVAVDCATVLGMMARRPMRFFRPAQCGALGAALGLARLARLDKQQTAALLGLTLAQLSGSMQAHVEGTAGLALQVGFNARNVISALDLVRQGLSGPLDAIDGPFGYLNLFEEDFDTSPINLLGRSFQIERVSHKPWPTGRAAQGALDVLESLLADGLDPSGVKSVRLEAPPLVRRLVDRPFQPDMSAQYARLCLPWLLSVCLVRGTVGLDDFSAAALRDPTRAEFVDRVSVAANAVDNPNRLLPQRLVVETVEGQRLEQAIDAVLGSPERPLDGSRRRDKARACAAHAGLSYEQTQRLFQHLDNIETLSDVSMLIDAMEM